MCTVLDVLADCIVPRDLESMCANGLLIQSSMNWSLFHQFGNQIIAKNTEGKKQEFPFISKLKYFKLYLVEEFGSKRSFLFLKY